MHPELLWSLAAERRRDLDAALNSGRIPRTRTPLTHTGGHPHPARHLLSLPSFRVSWTHATLVGAAGGRRGGSVMIVISATRPS